MSACLLGEKVRYDGGHKRVRFITDTLGRFVEFMPVCPEVECGLGVPREPMHLVGDPGSPRLVTVQSGMDHTDRMLSWAQQRVKVLEAEDLCGFIFKSGSPSCGMKRVKVYDAKGSPGKGGAGLFARAFMERFPLLPVEDEQRLYDPTLRENFIERIFTLMRWRELKAYRHSLGGLVDFHTQNKLLILSHSPKHYREMGRWVAEGKGKSSQELYERYEALLMAALRLKATVKKHTNVLLHLLGYFKRRLTPDERQELLEIIDRYREGHLPLIVPVTLINHYARKYREPYLLQQTYLNPHPTDLKLRNHA